MQQRPTEEAYAELQQAYDFYNDALFDGMLPPCLITFQRQKKTFGYFSSMRFGRRDGIKSDEIALNRMLKNAPMPSAISAPRGKISVHGLNSSLGT
jgi:hypothetical protein